MTRSNKKQRKYRADWVLRDEIALGSAPKRIEHLNYLNDLNIKSILSLCSEEEAPPPIEMKDKFTCSRLVLPDHRQGRLPKSSEKPSTGVGNQLQHMLFILPLGVGLGVQQQPLRKHLGRRRTIC